MTAARTLWFSGSRMALVVAPAGKVTFPQSSTGYSLIVQRRASGYTDANPKGCSVAADRNAHSASTGR